MAERASYERSSTEIPTSPVAAAGGSPEPSGIPADRDFSKSVPVDTSAYHSVIHSEVCHLYFNVFALLTGLDWGQHPSGASETEYSISKGKSDEVCTIHTS